MAIYPPPVKTHAWQCWNTKVYGSCETGGGGATCLDTTAADLYQLAVTSQLDPCATYRITDYRSVNWLNGYWNADNNTSPTITSAFAPYVPVNTNLVNGANSSVYAIAKDTVSGGVYVGGLFSGLIISAPPTYFQKLNADGTPNTAFNNNYYDALSVSPGFDATVFTIAVQSDGKVLVGGFFTTLNGTTRNRLVRFNADGTLDTAFYTNLGTAFNNQVNKIVIQPDGKILVGGTFNTFNGNTRGKLVRLNPDGTEDTAFATNVGGGAALTGYVINIVVSQFTPGKIYLVGGFADWNGNASTLNAVKLNADGTRDNTFTSRAPLGQKGYSFIYELSNGDLLMSDALTAQWDSTPLTSNVFRISATGAGVNLGWGNVTGIIATGPRVQVAKLSTGELVVASDDNANFDGVAVIAVYSEVGIRNTAYDPQGSFDQEVLALEVMNNGDYLLCGTNATGTYRGNATPESLIALDLSTASPFNARQIHTGDPEVIVVEAISPNRFGPQGYSETYGDLVEFNPICNTMALPDPNGVQNGNLLPNGNTISGFDLQWDGQNAYFMMPTGYPILFGHLLYITWQANVSDDYYFFCDPILPGINYNKEDYGVDQDGFSVPYITISNDGMKVTLNGVTEQQFLDYQTDTLYLDVCIESQGPAYGHMNRRTDVNNEISLPLDWRNFRYRRYQLDPSASTGGVFANEYVLTSDANSTGGYKDYPVIASEAYSFQVSGRGGTTAYWWWNGTVENVAMPQWSYAYNVNMQGDYFESITFNNQCRNLFTNCRSISNVALGNTDDFAINGEGIYYSFIQNLFRTRFQQADAMFGLIVSQLYYVNCETNIGGDLTGNTYLGSAASYNKRIFKASTGAQFLEYFDGTAMQYVTSPF